MIDRIQQFKADWAATHPNGQEWTPADVKAWRDYHYPPIPPAESPPNKESAAGGIAAETGNGMCMTKNVTPEAAAQPPPPDNVVNISTVCAWVKLYQTAGLRPIRLCHKMPDGRCSAGHTGCTEGKPSVGKRPIGNEWETRAWSLFEFQADDNIGLVMGTQPDGRRLVAIDVDGEPSELFKIAPDDASNWPSTMTARTGSGGLHIVYEWPQGLPLPTSRTRLPGTCIDLRAEGGQIVVEPSVHRNGKRYEWIVRADIAQIPVETAKAILALAGAKSPAAKVAGSSAVNALLEVTKPLAAAFARAFPEHGERHKACLDLSGMLIRRGWPKERAAACLEAVLLQTGWEYSPDEAQNDVKTTLERARQGQAYAGKTSLEETLAARGQGAVVDDFLEALDLHEHLQKTEKGAIKPSLANLSQIFSRHLAWTEALALDTFSQKIIKRAAVPVLPDERPHESKPEWFDADSSRSATWLSSVYGMTVAAGTVADKVRDVALARAFHPVREYLQGLTWDGVPRIHTLFSRGFGAHETPYTSAISRYFMIGAVARVMTLGATKLDTVPILVGEQGTFKSSGLKALVPDEGWFADTPIDMHNKDSMLAVQGVWIYELAELAKMKDSDVELVKAFVSRSVDRFRVPYGRGVESFERQVALIATTNELKLRDTTGNRRFWPVQCLKNTDVAWIKDNRAQLWAEALDAQRKGGQWWATEEIEVLCKAEQDDSLEQEPWHDEIAKHLAALCAPTVRTDVSAFAADTTDPWEGITTGQILSKAIGKSLEHRTSHDTQSVINTLRHLRWKPWPTNNGKRKVDGVALRVWIPPTEKPENWTRGVPADGRMPPVVLGQYP